MVEVLAERELKGTPMEGNAQYFIDAGKKYNVDPLFLLAIGSHESGYGKFYSKAANDQRHSYAGVMTWTENKERVLQSYTTWKDAIYDHARLIREKYLDQGKVTIKAIWFSYAPPIEVTNDSWGPAVARKYNLLTSHF